MQATVAIETESESAGTRRVLAEEIEEAIEGAMGPGAIGLEAAGRSIAHGLLPAACSSAA